MAHQYNDVVGYRFEANGELIPALVLSSVQIPPHFNGKQLSDKPEEHLNLVFLNPAVGRMTAQSADPAAYVVIKFSVPASKDGQIGFVDEPEGLSPKAAEAEPETDISPDGTLDPAAVSQADGAAADDSQQQQ